MSSPTPPTKGESIVIAYGCSSLFFLAGLVVAILGIVSYCQGENGLEELVRGGFAMALALVIFFTFRFLKERL